MKKAVLMMVILLLASAAQGVAATRIISLAPNTTEILFSIGLGDSIVGIDDFSNYPPEANQIERLGAFNNPNIERIIILRPDYILVNSSLERQKEDYLKSLGIKIIRISPKTVEGLYGDIRKLGEIFGKAQPAEDVINRMNARIARVEKNKNGNTPKVFIQLFHDPLTTVSCFVSDVIRLAGGENIALDVKEDAGIFSCEALIDRDPDIILELGFNSSADFPASIKAVKNKKVYSNINPDIILRPGPRTADGIEALNKVFYE